MFTRKRIALPNYSGSGERDFNALKDAIRVYLQSLEGKQSLTLDSATGLDNTPIGAITPNTGAFTRLNVTASSVFPTGTWTPVLTFATPGNLSVSYSTQTGDYTRIGRMVFASFAIITSAFTWTTASGSLEITGLPFTSANLSGRFWAGALTQWQGITKTGFTSMALRLAANSSALLVFASGSGQASSGLQASDLPTTGTV